MPERTQPQATGIFDKRQATSSTDQSAAAIPVQAAPPKEDFTDPFRAAASQAIDKVRPTQKPVTTQSDAAAEKTAQALNNASTKELEKEFEEMDKITPQEMELAEQMIFNGYAEFDAEMPNLPNHKFTICSTNAEEMTLIDDVIFDMVKLAEDKADGTVDMPQNKVQAMRNALFLALAYRGVDKKEIMGPDTISHLNTIKKAIIKVSELENAGEMIKAKELKDSLKKALIKRATAIKRLPTPTIDFLSGEKYRFDSRMLSIMSSKKILPKS